MGLGDFLKGLATRANMGFADFLNGKSAPATDKIGQLKIGDDGIAQIDMGGSQNPRSGGFLQGFQENRTTPFAVENLEPNNKGWNFKLGEVAGTTARGIGKFGEGIETGLKAVGRGLDSPLGRAALVGGIVGLTGGNPLQMLTYGATTGMMNQANRMADRVYRDDLIKSGRQSVMNMPGFNKLSPEKQQELLNEVDNRVNSYRGYMTQDVYRNQIDSQIAQENAAYRRMYYDNQRKQDERENQLRQQQLYLTDKGQRLNYEIDLRKLKLQEEKLQKGTAKFRTSIGDKKNALQQIKAIRELVKNNPNATGYIVGKFAKGQEAGQKIANEFLSKDPEAIKTRAAISKLRGTTMHDLAGTAQTLQEQRNLAPFLPDSTDNHKTIMSKLDQLEAELLQEIQTLNNTGMSLGYDIDDMNYSYPSQQTTKESQPKTTTQKIGKYSVEVQ